MINDFLERVDTRDKIDCIRKNILVHTAKNENAPKKVHKLQLYLKSLKLKEELQRGSKLLQNASQGSERSRRDKVLLDEIGADSKKIDGF